MKNFQDNLLLLSNELCDLQKDNSHMEVAKAGFLIAMTSDRPELTPEIKEQVYTQFLTTYDDIQKRKKEALEPTTFRSTMWALADVDVKLMIGARMEGRKKIFRDIMEELMNDPLARISEKVQAGFVEHLKK